MVTRRLGLELAVLVVALGLGFVVLRGKSTPTELPPPVLPGYEEPYTFEELKAEFESDVAGFDAVRKIAMALPYAKITMQTDYLNWDGSNDGWTLNGSTGLWHNFHDRGQERRTAEVLADAKLTSDDYAALCTLCARHSLLFVSRVVDPIVESDGPYIEFSPRRGTFNFRSARAIVWHAILQPIADREQDHLLSETHWVHQRVSEDALPSPGWFVRSTLPTSD